MSVSPLPKLLPEPGRHHFPRARFAYLLMFASALAFASMSACARGLQERIDWRLTAVARAGLAFLFTAIIAGRLGVGLPRPVPRTLWMRSTVGSLGMLCSFYALAHLPISGAVTLMNSFPLWVALLSWPVLGMRPTTGVWLAVASGLGGVFCIARSYDRAGDVANGHYFAMALALAASFTTSVVMLGLHRLRRVNPLAIALHFAAFSTVACLGYTLFTGWGAPLALHGFEQPATWLLVAGVGGFATAGQLLMTTAFQHGPPSHLATIGLMQVVFAVAFELLFWDHGFGSGVLGGITLILCPAVWLVRRRRLSPRLAISSALR